MYYSFISKYTVDQTVHSSDRTVDHARIEEIIVVEIISPASLNRLEDDVDPFSNFESEIVDEDEQISNGNDEHANLDANVAVKSEPVPVHEICASNNLELDLALGLCGEASNSQTNLNMDRQDTNQSTMTDTDIESVVEFTVSNQSSHIENTIVNASSLCNESASEPVVDTLATSLSTISALVANQTSISNDSISTPIMDTPVVQEISVSQEEQQTGVLIVEAVPPTSTEAQASHKNVSTNQSSSQMDEGKL